MSWELIAALVPKFLRVVCAVLAWRLTEAATTCSIHLNVVLAIGSVLLFLALGGNIPVFQDLFRQTRVRALNGCILTATLLRLDYLLLNHANMLVTGAAVFWLAHRAWQTLRKPAIELINVLGVEVPDPPDVSLAGIRSDAATLTWNRPPQIRPVAKFLIQVNGVNVGESASQETGITVTGLKPDHFYNIRVIAVGHNNFQTGSRIIRLRTYAKDGLPQLGDGRLPASFVSPETQTTTPGDVNAEADVLRGPAAAVEAISAAETTPVPSREAGNVGLGLRRNTSTGRRLPCEPSADHDASSEQCAGDSLGGKDEQSLPQLGGRFESIRKELEDLQIQHAADEEEHKQLMNELALEKKTKRRMLKDKEDATEKLKREVGATDRAMRSAQQRKTQKEKLLRERTSEQQKLCDDMAKWDQEIAQMRDQRAALELEKPKIQQEVDRQIAELRGDIEGLQVSLAKDEAELKDKGRELKEAEDQRKKLPGGEESEESNETEQQIRQTWDDKSQELQQRLTRSLSRENELTAYELQLRAQLAALQQSALPLTYRQTTSSDAEHDLATPTLPTRRNRSSISISNTIQPSPSAPHSMVDRSFAPPAGFSSHWTGTLPPGFGIGMGFNQAIAASRDEIGGTMIAAANAPLSPTAASLLPAALLDNADDDVPGASMTHGRWVLPSIQQGHAQLPHSALQSPSATLNRRGSGQDQAHLHGTRDVTGRAHLGDYGVTASPNLASANTSNRSSRNFLPWVSRSPKPSSDKSPPLGSLKLGHSQSFPRQGEESGPVSRKRRVSISHAWDLLGRNTGRPHLQDTGDSGFAGTGSRRPGPSRNLHSTSGISPSRDFDSPRPASTASTDLPRPSTEGGSIWRQHPTTRRLWLSEGADPWTSRAGSRRPSIGSPSQMKTTLADADDEILDESELRQTPSVGVIGMKSSGPVIPSSTSQPLNPAAPDFMSALRAKEREAKDVKAARDTPLQGDPGSLNATFPFLQEFSSSGGPQADDALSVHNPSVALSGESTLGQTSASEGHREQESGLRKLLRKASSSKFTRAVSAKKGPGSMTSSDKNVSYGRTSLDETGEDGGDGGDGLLGRSYESLSSSPFSGPASIGKPAKDKESRGSWTGRFMKKKSGREKGSLDLERPEPAASAIEDGNKEVL